MEKEIKNLIKNGESQGLEFKLNSENIGKDICAFANTNDGIILVGVGDKGASEGIKNIKKMEEEIANISHSCDPPVRIKIDKEDTLLVVKVKKSARIHSFNGIVYVRVGSTDRALSMQEVLDHGHKLGKIEFDKQICEGTKLKDIDWNFIKNFFIKKYEIVNKTRISSVTKNLLENLGCIKNNKPTNAGILLFGKDPQKFFMNAYVAIAKYKEKVVSGERLDYKEFNGNIFKQIDGAVKYIIDNIAIMSRLIPGIVEREDIPEYPLFSIREIITNAITHRDYKQESKVIIKIFSDKIEVYNPGGLLAGITPKNIVDKQYSRNPILAKVLSKVKYIEELGEGWDKIIEEHKTYPLKPKMPLIKDVDGSVIVNVFSVKKKFTEVKLRKYDLNERQRFVLDYLKSNLSVRSIDIQKRFGITRDTASRDLNELIKLALIKRRGAGKSTRYRLK